jgi:outer membrane protein OmpA-like peptidoglycan-associated protein
MKQKLSLVFAVMLISLCGFSQDMESRFAGPKKGAVLAVHFNMADYKAPLGIKSPSSGRVYSTIKEMSKGFSISYWRGLTKKIDLSIKANGMFLEYPTLSSTVISRREFSPELEAAFNIRPFGDNSLIAPFLTAGIGGAYPVDQKQFGAYAPLGLGVQANFNSMAYVFLQAQYRLSLTEKYLDDNTFYSLGLGQSIGKKKAAAPVVIAPPVVETPKDRDGDGVIDADDKCPDVAGVASLQGCPDKDGDGITDADDKCPDVAGVARYQGCPIPDTDKDGINDEEDKCVNVAGVARYQGCPIPDTDKDGVNDEEDKCVNEAGPASNFGCPVINEAIVQRINAAAKNVFFATGSAKLLAKSFKPLNDVVKILNENPSYNLTIDGHTDNTGDAAKNQTLSESRAASVLDYITSKGIAADRLASAGYGQDKPAADNKTAAGRALNRRVEMTARNYK